MSDRVQQAREEIGRRRALAQAATPGPWVYGSVRVFSNLSPADSAHVAANDPAHVLAVLDGHESVLDRHTFEQHDVIGTPTGVGWTQCSRNCGDADGYLSEWPCPDAAVVLDLYAPEATHVQPPMRPELPPVSGQRPPEGAALCREPWWHPAHCPCHIAGRPPEGTNP